MELFAEKLSRYEFRGAPITDETGLKGVYSFSLHFETFDQTPSTATEAVEPLPTVFQALGQQGLKLTPKKVMGDVFVIDHVEKNPIEN
jgi:uncharacterized protein (TIGR03435 family)